MGELGNQNLVIVNMERYLVFGYVMGYDDDGICLPVSKTTFRDHGS